MTPPESRYVGDLRVEAQVVRTIYASTERHVCSPYCRAGRHAELIYREELDTLTIALAQAIADLASPRCLVLDVRPAPEARLPAGFRAAWLVTYGPRREPRQ